MAEKRGGWRVGRPAGLGLLAGLVVLGMGIPAIYRWMSVRLKAERVELLERSPSEPEARLAQWLRFGQPQIHHALEAARFSAREPWFVTHVIAPASAAEPPQVFGLDFTDLAHEVVRQEGLVVRVVLDAPKLLARDVLTGDKALGVPIFQPDVAPPDGRVLALLRLVPYLERLEQGLERDLPGASLEVEVGGLKEGVSQSEGLPSDGH
mgnify:CR=1 FL=1